MTHWYLAIDLPGPGCDDFAAFLLFEIDEQKRMTLLKRWYADIAALAEKEQDGNTNS